MTVVAYMGMMYRAMEVAEGSPEDVRGDVDAHPAPHGHRRSSAVRKTHRAVVIAGAGFAGMGSEILSFMRSRPSTI